MPDAPRLRRPRAITLVLLGSAALSLGACESRETRCVRARAENRPDAQAICSGSGSSSRSGTSWFGYSGGGSGSSTGAATSGVSGSSARGGFGGSSASAGG